MEIFPASCEVRTFHAVIDNFSTAGQATPPAPIWPVIFTPWNMCCILQNKSCPIYCIGIIVKYCIIAVIHCMFKNDWVITVAESLQLPHPDQIGALNRLRFFTIREAQWGCPEQLCCPCADKWLPLFKGPAPHLDKQRNQQNTLKKIPSLMFAQSLAYLFAPQVILDIVHVPLNLWGVEASLFKSRWFRNMSVTPIILASA